MKTEKKGKRKVKKKPQGTPVYNFYGTVVMIWAHLGINKKGYTGIVRFLCWGAYIEKHRKEGAYSFVRRRSGKRCLLFNATLDKIVIFLLP